KSTRRVMSFPRQCAQFMSVLRRLREALFGRTSPDRSPIGAPSCLALTASTHRRIGLPAGKTRMKTNLICTAVLALTASFGAAAQDTATQGCIQELAFEPRLTIIASKVDVVHAVAMPQAPERAATPEERAAVGLWLHL